MSPVSPRHPDELPASFGRYRLIKLLGKGGMGSVFLAHDAQLDRPVALKIPQLGSTQTASVLARFLTEARAAAAVHHPNICPIHEVGEIDGVPYLTMAFVEGKSLGEYAALRPLSPRQSVALVRKLALALDEAHKRGVVHRDLKPANIMIDRRGEPIIMDFGLARRARPGDVRLTQDGACMGTPAYMPPEQVKGEIDVMGPASDIYSLGVILYELLAGRLPFSGDVMAVLAQVVMEEPPPPSRFCPELDPELEAICLKAMAKKIEDRYPSMAQLAAALLAYLRGNTAATQGPEPAKGSKTAPAADAAARNSRRNDSGTQPEGIRVGQMGGLRSMATQPPSADKPRRRKPKRERRQRMPSWVWIAAGGAAALLIVLIGWAARRATSHAIKRIDRGAVATAIDRQVDGNQKPPESSEEPPTKPKESSVEERRFHGHEGPIRSVVFSPDGQYALSGSGFPQGDKTVRLWHIASGIEVRRFVGHEHWVNMIAFSPDGKRIVSSSFDRTVRLWDVDTGRQLRLFRHDKDTTGVAFTPDGKRILSAGFDNTVRLWDVDTGKELRKFEGHTRGVLAVALAPGGKRFLSASWDGTVRLWDLEMGKELHCYEIATPLFDVAFLPDGRRFLTGGEDGILRLWDLDADKEVLRFQGHTKPVYGLVVSRDGSRALSASVDGTARLWEVATGRELYRLRHRETVHAVALSTDQRYVLTGSGGMFRDGQWEAGTDWAVRLWRLPDMPAAKDKP